MNKTDFQNGFALGRASGGVVEVPGTLPDWDDDSPIIASGKCTGSNNNTWSLTEKGTLRIHKTGTDLTAVGSSIMPNTPLELMKVLHKIKQVYVPDGMKEVQLYNVVNCERVRFPDDFEHFIAHWCYNLKERDYNLFRFSNNSIDAAASCENWFSLEKVILPPTVCTIGNRAFSNCFGLKEIDLQYITTFGTSIFNNCCCLNLDIVLNAGLIRIYPQAFYNSGIKSVKFQNSVDNLPTIDATAFAFCRELTDIYCPWAEGAVANAPWGATNATIHYNYVEGEETNAES